MQFRTPKSAAALPTLVFLTLVQAAPALAQHKTPTEAQCREMVNSMLQTMRTVPIEREADRKGAREVTERAEKVVRDNRARGASECDSWGQIMNIVTRQ